MMPKSLRTVRFFDERHRKRLFVGWHLARYVAGIDPIDMEHEIHLLLGHDGGMIRFLDNICHFVNTSRYSRMLLTERTIERRIIGIKRLPGADAL